MGGVYDERVKSLALGGHHPESLQPRSRYSASRGLPLTDLVAVDDQDIGPSPPSSRATASPAKLAPQTKTS